MISDDEMSNQFQQSKLEESEDSIAYSEEEKLDEELYEDDLDEKMDIDESNTEA